MTENEPHGGYINTLDDGTRLHTYYPMPVDWCCRQHLLKLPPESDLFGVAVQEAGHLIAALVGGIHVVRVTLKQGKGPCRIRPRRRLSGQLPDHVGRWRGGPSALADGVRVR